MEVCSRGVEGMSRFEGGPGKQVSYQALHHVYHTRPDEAEGVLELTGLHAHTLHTRASTVMHVTVSALYM